MQKTIVSIAIVACLALSANVRSQEVITPEIINQYTYYRPGALVLAMDCNIPPMVEYMAQYNCGDGSWENLGTFITYSTAIVTVNWRLTGWNACYGYNTPSNASMTFRLVELASLENTSIDPLVGTGPYDDPPVTGGDDDDDPSGPPPPPGQAG